MVIASIDKHPVLRKGLGIFLKSQYEHATILEAACFKSFQKTYSTQLPDLIICGLEENSQHFDTNILEIVKEKMPKAALVIYDGEPRYSMAVSCLKAGASGYLLKNEELEELIKCIETVTQGRKYASEILMEIMLSQEI